MQFIVEVFLPLQNVGYMFIKCYLFLSTQHFWLRAGTAETVVQFAVPCSGPNLRISIVSSCSGPPQYMFRVLVPGMEKKLRKDAAYFKSYLAKLRDIYPKSNLKCH